MRAFYLDQQIHHISGHLLYQDVNHSQYLSLGSGQRGGVNVLLRLRVGLGCIEPMHLENHKKHLGSQDEECEETVLNIERVI